MVDFTVVINIVIAIVSIIVNSLLIKRSNKLNQASKFLSPIIQHHHALQIKVQALGDKIPTKEVKDLVPVLITACRQYGAVSKKGKDLLNKAESIGLLIAKLADESLRDKSYSDLTIKIDEMGKMILDNNKG